MREQLANFISANSDWLYPALAGAAGWCAVKYWERARPLCFAESFYTGLPAHETIKLPDSIHDLFAKSPSVAVQPYSNLSVRDATSAFTECLATIRLIQISKPDVEQLVASAATATTLAERKQWIVRAARLKVLPEFFVLGLIRDELVLKGTDVDMTADVVLPLLKSTEDGNELISLKHGGALHPLVGQTPRTPTNFDLASPFLKAFERADVHCLAKFFSDGLRLLDEQLELHRKIAKTIQPLLGQEARIAGQFCLVNRGAQRY
ncbi:MAG: hypothetical protein QM783_09350 [Phycisphaerales bacterium]